MSSAVITPQIQEDVSALYIAFWDRAPDTEGFAYWARQLAGGMSLDRAAAIFLAEPEGQAVYPGLTPQESIERVYVNVFGRVGDAGGIAYWTNQITASNPFSNVVVDMLAYASWAATQDGNTDGELLNNKIAVGIYTAQNFPNASSTVLYSAFNDVTADPASIAVAEAAIMVAGANQINITTPVAQTYIAPAGNNTFNALGYLKTDGTVIASLVSGDSLIGSSNGYNTLNANLFETTVTPTALTNIQQLILTNTGAGATINVTNSNAIEAVTAQNLAGNLAVNNVQSAEIDYTLKNISTTASFTVTAATGVLDDGGTATVVLSNVSGGNNIVLPSEFTGLELVSIGTTANAVSTDFVGRNANGTGGITITGSNNLTLDGVAASNITAAVVDASDFTGNLTTTMSDSVTVTYTGGSGNDNIRLVDASGGISMDMGAGTDLLMVDNLAQVSSELSILGGLGTDTLRLGSIDASGANADKSLDPVAGFETLRLAGGTTTSNVITLGTNFVNAGFTTVTSTGTGDNITVANATLTNGTVFNSTVGTGTGTLTLNTAGGTFTVNGYETIATSGTVANNITIGGTASTTVSSSAGGLQTLTLADSALQTLTLTGSSQFAVNGSASTGDKVVLGASTGSTGGLTTITGGAGGLYVDASASTAANVITFTAGTNTLLVDNLTNTSAAASITGGTGTDTLQAVELLTTGANADKSLDSITGGFDVLRLAAGNGASTSNVITLGTNFVNAGFTTVTSTGSGDSITVANATLTSGTIFNSVGTGTGTLTLNTAGGTFTVNNYGDIVTSGTVANNITIGGTATTTITSNAGGLQTLTLADAGLHTLTLSGTSQFAVNGSATTGDQVILGANDGTTGGQTTITGGAGGLYVNASASEAANVITFTAGTNTLLVDDLAGVSAAASITGGSGSSDTLQVSAVLSTGANADKSLDSITGGFETLRLAGGTTTSNVITLGTNFVNAGFTTVTSTGTGDNITVANAALTGQLFQNTVGTGTGTLTLNTASGSLTVNDYGTIIGNGSAVNLTLTGDVTSNMGISLFTGSTVTNLNTFTSTITLTGASTYTGNMVNDILTIGSGAAMTINGGGGNDRVTLGANTSNLTITTGGNTGTMSVVGSQSINETVAFTNTGTFGVTSVETATFGSAVDLDAFVLMNTTAGLSATYNYDLTGASTGDFFIATTGTAGTVVLTVDSGVGSTVRFLEGAGFTAATSSANVVFDTNGQLSTVTLSSLSAVNEKVQVNLANVANSTNTAGGVVVSNLSSSTDDLNLYGISLTNANGISTFQYQNAVSASGFTNTNSFTLGTTFITGTSTAVTGSLADLTSATNAAGLIFYTDSSSTLAGTTASFTTQAGINSAVSYITSRIGTAGTGASQVAVIAVTNDTDGGGIDQTALFLFESDGTTGIVSSELSLIGVVNGNVNAATFFS